jgi:hypothetical protein
MRGGAAQLSHTTDQTYAVGTVVRYQGVRDCVIRTYQAEVRAPSLCTFTHAQTYTVRLQSHSGPHRQTLMGCVRICVCVCAYVCVCVCVCVCVRF